MERKKTRLANTILKENKVGGLILLKWDLQSSYCSQDRVVLVKKSRQTDQWNRLETPEIDSHTELLFDKGAKAIKWRKDFLQEMVAE